MAAQGAVVTVATTATELTGLGTDNTAGQILFLQNKGANAVFLGASGVTTATGYSLAVNATLGPIVLGQGEQLYGIVAAATEVVHVLRVGV